MLRVEREKNGGQKLYTDCKHESAKESAKLPRKQEPGNLNLLELMAAELGLERQIHQVDKVDKAASTVSMQSTQKVSWPSIVQMNSVVTQKQRMWATWDRRRATWNRRHLKHLAMRSRWTKI